jgi:hypothetical protein
MSDAGLQVGPAAQGHVRQTEPFDHGAVDGARRWGRRFAQLGMPAKAGRVRCGREAKRIYWPRKHQSRKVAYWERKEEHACGQ